MPLDTYLLKPVQRISKYQLLLKESLKCCPKQDKEIVEQALDSMLDVVNNLNDIMHASFIVGFADLKLQGRLLKRDQLQLSKLKRNAKQSGALNVVSRLKLNDSNKYVEVFLFEKAIVICKRKADDPSNHVTSSFMTAANASTTGTLAHHQSSGNISSPSPSSSSSPSVNSTVSNHSLLATHHSSSSVSSTSSLPQPSSSFQFSFQYFYQFKEVIKTNEIGLTENLKNDKRKFEIWSDSSSYVFEAANEQKKQSWIVHIKSILESQLNEIKCKPASILL